MKYELLNNKITSQEVLDVMETCMEHEMGYRTVYVESLRENNIINNIFSRNIYVKFNGTNGESVITNNHNYLHHLPGLLHKFAHLSNVRKIIVF